MWLLRPQILIPIFFLLSVSRVAASKEENALASQVSRVPANVYGYCSELVGLKPETKATEAELRTVLDCAEHVELEPGQTKPIPFEGDRNTRYGRGVREPSP